jgi:predicted N-acyltransferase
MRRAFAPLVAGLLALTALAAVSLRSGVTLRSSTPSSSVDLNIQAVLELESMEDIVWKHIPQPDQEKIIQHWFWDSMGAWQCIQKKEMDVSNCIMKYENSMLMLMGGVINNKYITACQGLFDTDKTDYTLDDIKAIGKQCWDKIDQKREQAIVVYELLGMKDATNCVNRAGGSVCGCSDQFNNGIKNSLNGVVSDATKTDIFSHLTKYC